jgi:DNA-binding beta-propeller fold protein YncE
MTALLALAAPLLLPGTARAQTTVFAFSKGIYADAKQVQLRGPEGVACSDAGTVVVADTGNARLVRYTFQDGALGGGAEQKVPQVAYPLRMELDSKQDLLVLDGKKKQIAMLDPKGAFVRYLDLGDSGMTKTMVTAFKLDGVDNVYVLDVVAGKVLVIDAKGGVSRRLDLPPGKQTGFTDVAVDPAGTIYVVDAVTSTVWSAEKGSTAFKALSRSLKDSILFPRYLEVNRGRLFVVDYNGHGIAVLGLDGSFQGRQLGMGNVEGVVYYPTQLCMTEKYAFLADRSNNRVQVFTVGR